jgi:ABC-type uncharacterized transport system auxiliary subunit
MKKNALRHWMPLLLLLLLPAGCMHPSSVPVYYYALDYPSAPLKSAKRPLPFVLRVERFTAPPPFNSPRIVYSDKGLHRNVYAHFQWVAAPGELIAYGLARDLNMSQAFRAVLAPDSALSPTHTISGWVEEFLEKDSCEPAQASAKIHISLTDARNPDPLQRILFQKSYSAEAPCASKTPAGMAEAMSRVMAELSASITRDIYQRLLQAQHP